MQSLWYCVILASCYHGYLVDIQNEQNTRKDGEKAISNEKKMINSKCQQDQRKDFNEYTAGI